MQYLQTDGEIGYLVVELDVEASQNILSALKDLKHSICTRVLFYGPGYVGQKL